MEKKTAVDSSQAGKKAWTETIRPTEYGYMDMFVKEKKAKTCELFHHEGLPDIMRIMPSGKIQFFEIKPKKGSKKRRLLNRTQNITIKKLFQNEMVEGVVIVQYEKKGKIQS